MWPILHEREGLMIYTAGELARLTGTTPAMLQALPGSPAGDRRAAEADAQVAGTADQLPSYSSPLLAISTEHHARRRT